MSFQATGSAKNVVDTGHLTLTLEGLSTLITHRRNESQNTGNRTPEEEFEASLYELREGVYGFPADGIFSAIRNAAGGLLTGVTIAGGRLLEIRGPKPEIGSAPVTRNGFPTMGYRPEFFPWEIDVPLIFDRNRNDEQSLFNLFSSAGLNIGIGDWRPEKGGRSGTFRVKQVKLRGVVYECDEQGVPRQSNGDSLWEKQPMRA